MFEDKNKGPGSPDYADVSILVVCHYRTHAANRRLPNDNNAQTKSISKYQCRCLLWNGSVCSRFHLPKTSMVWFFLTLDLGLLSVSLLNLELQSYKVVFFPLCVLDLYCGVLQAWWTRLWCLWWVTWWTCGMCLSTEVCMLLLMWLSAWDLL